MHNFASIYLRIIKTDIGASARLEEIKRFSKTNIRGYHYVHVNVAFEAWMVFAGVAVDIDDFAAL